MENPVLTIADELFRTLCALTDDPMLMMTALQVTNSLVNHKAIEDQQRQQQSHLIPPPGFRG